ncbi:MAG: long-chain-acyl-CoA synthetase [Pseudomonadales bacterium]|nr:long-chain-acyl-CoA synthetase [Pseudomonadales bacterium]
MTSSASINPVSLLKNTPTPLTFISGTGKALKSLGRQWLHGNINYAAFVEAAVDSYPDNVLIKYKENQITYRQFNESANQIAHYLKLQGFGFGNVIGLFMENRPEYLIYLTAISKIGATAALINNAQQGKVLIHSINLVTPKAIIVGSEVALPLEAIKSQLDSKIAVYEVPDPDTNTQVPNDHFIDISIEAINCSKENPPDTRHIDPDTPCLYIYTSGTTGLPKASIQRHKKLVSIAVTLGMLSGATNRKDTIYSTLPLYHATALYFSWLTVLANGASLAIRRKFSASEFWKDIIHYDASIFVYVGELCRYLLNQPESALDKQHAIRLITGNGMRPELWNSFKERFDIKEVREFYGSSEGNLACYNLFNQNKTMGMALGSYAIVKIDTETEEPLRDANGYLIKCDKKETGLLLGQITKLTPFDGYTDSSKNTSKIFHNAFKQGDAWFNTGDLVKPQGFRHLQFVDRLGDTFRWKGENVSTGEVEMIVNQFPQISESITYGVEIPDTNGRAGMTALLLEDGITDIDTTELYQYLKSQLPGYAVPIFLRTLTSVNATGTFKYQRSHLKQQSYHKAAFETARDRVYVVLPGTNEYIEADQQIIDKIDQGAYRF